MSRGFYILVFIYVLNIYFAFEGRSNVKVYSVDDGLSQSSISCLFQDSDGYLWIGTQDGLNLFNGYTFHIFRYQPTDSTSISSNNILSICEDKDGFIWVGTDNGLNRFNKKKWEFKNYILRNPESNARINIPVLDVFQDSQNKIWAKTQAKLYYYYENADSFFTTNSYDISSSIIQDVNSSQIIDSDSNMLWVGTDDGLFIFDPYDGVLVNKYAHKSTNKNSLSSNNIKCIFKDDKNNIWIGTSNGLNKYIKGSDNFKRIYPSKSSNSVLGDDINFLLQLTEDIILVGTGKGLCNLRISDGEILNQSVFEEYEIHLNQNNFLSALKDGSDVLWLGTIRGLIKRDLKGNKFELFNFKKNSFPGIGSYDIASIAIDDRNRLWLGTWGEGFSIIENGKVKTFRTSQYGNNFNTGKDYVHSIFFKDKNEIWLGTRDGVAVFDPRTKRTYELCNLKKGIDCSLLRNSRVYFMYKMNKESYLIGTNIGLVFYNEEEGRAEKYNTLNSDTLSVDFDIVYCVKRDKNSNLWFGTNNGVVVTDNSLNVKLHFQHDLTKTTKNILSDNNIYAIYEDQKGRIWIGTKSGLNLYLPHEHRFKIITEKEGLPNNLIYAMHEDNSGNLWMSTNQGLVKLEPDSYEISSYGITDGLQSTEFNLGASFKNPKTGKLYFGGINGLNRFDPDSLIKNQYIPNVVVTSIEFIARDGTEKVFFTGDSLITIKSKTPVTISYSALDFTHPEKNRYKYRLSLKNKKDEDDWFDAKNRNFVTFQGLSPGNYLFQVKGTNSDGIEYPEPTSVELLVKPEIWESKTAYFFYILMVVGLAYSFVHYRTRTLRKLNREYKERERINRQVQKQKEELVVKNKNITDSINYAKRIQEAIMPSISTVRRILPNSFVLHMPKDIVSGDFYWIHEKENKVFIAAVDCTGHGVPGAFMSIIGFELFRKITNAQGIENPSDILNTLNADFAEIFRDVSDFTLRDGMDMAFCVFDKSTRILEFSGAFNPLYIIRDNKISEIKGNRFSVGIETFPEEDKLFKNHSIALEDDDMVFIFSDGYADQFGGPEGKKYKYRRFRHLLLTIHKLPLEVQQDLLQKSILEWKGELDQVDDILVIGFKP